MIENTYIEKKSLSGFTKRNVDWDEIAMENDRQAYQWETQTALKISRNDFDKDKIKSFRADMQASQRISDFVKSKSNDELLDYYFFAKGEFLTNLGILWIGKREHRAELMYSPSIQFIKYDELERKVRKLVWDDYSLNTKEMLVSIWQSIPEFQEYLEFPDGIFRRNIYHYDESVVRELIVNALVHRPYTTRGDIFINLYNDRLEIHNPGLLPLGVSPNNILHTSIQRNPHLSKVFYDLMLMEKEGSGYDLIYQNLLSAGKELPEIIERDDRVVVVIKKKIINSEIVNDIDRIVSKYQLKTKEIIIIGLILQFNSLSLNEISKLINQKIDIIKKDWLKGLIENNLIFKSSNGEEIYSVNVSLINQK